MSIDGPDPLAVRVSGLRWATAAALTGLLLNAGIVVVLVALISQSVLVALAAVGAMAAFVFLFALFSEARMLGATRARPLLEGEFPWLPAMVRELADDAGIPQPQVLISDQDDLNAYTTGTGAHAKVVFMRGLLHQLTRDQIRAVAAHEIGHVTNRDVSLGVWTGAIYSWVFVLGSVLAFLAHIILEFARQTPKGVGAGSGPIGEVFAVFLAIMGYLFGIFVWAVAQVWMLIALLCQLGVTRQREWLADATAVALTGQPQDLAKALATIAEDPYLVRGGRTVGRFCIVYPASGGGWWDELTSTHPAPNRRIEELSKLPNFNPTFSREQWKGIGSLSLFLPAGTIVLLALLALSVPLITGSQEGNQSASYQPPPIQRPQQGGLSGPSQSSNTHLGTYRNSHGNRPNADPDQHVTANQTH